MARKNRKPRQRRKAKAEREGEGLRIQGDLLEDMQQEGADVDRGEGEVIPVVFLSDLADVAAEREASDLADMPETDDIPVAADPAPDRLTTAVHMAREGRMQEAVLLYMEIRDESRRISIPPC